jgi:uracil-DNA glycosylase family 4
MEHKQYQKKILLELMKLEEFNEYFDPLQKASMPLQNEVNVVKNINSSRPNTFNKIEDIESNLFSNYNIKTSFIEGDHLSKIMFFYGKCNVDDKKILDGEPGKLFDKMLGSINLSRENIALASYIPRGYENYYDNEKFINEIQLFNYRIIELINPRYLIIMSNYCIKMLLATDLSSMSLRGKWFDFNTPNDTNPKKTRVLYEPTLLMNNPDLKKDAWEDLKEIKSKLGG